MDISVGQGATIDEAVRAPGVGPFSFVTIHSNCTAEVSTGVIDPGCSLHGSTSCLGAMTHDGTTTGAAAFATRDDEGAYGTAVAAFDAGPRAAARDATRGALLSADRLGEQPDRVWISATPGAEEEILAGVEEVVGPDIPIIGGSAADNP